MEGAPFGRYRLMAMLGRGGMGEVWRAFDTETNRTVAIKLLPAHLAADTGFQARFRREAQTAAVLNDPHVVPIHNFGEIDGRLYLDMRLIEGRDLDDLIRQGPLPVARAVTIVEQIGSALNAAHQAGLVHRDVKPSNVLVTDRDFAYLIDFGIARGTEDTSMTSTGLAIGTVAYMAPERFTTGLADARSDVYSLACMLHECLTGTRPFPGESPEQQLAGHLTTPPPRPSVMTPGIPAELDTVIAAGMAKDPDQRYQNTTAFTDAARTAINSPAPPPSPGWNFEPSRAGSTSRPWWRRKPVIIATALVTVLAVITTVVITTTGGTAGPSTNSAPSLRPATSAPDTSASDTSKPPTRPPGQSALPFTGLNKQAGIAVDSAGAVYVADSGNNRVLRLAAGADTQEELPFVGLKTPEGLAVDSAGAVYVADSGNNRVLRLAAGSTSQEEVAFTGLSLPEGLAVDSTGTTYVADFKNNRVLRLAAGSTSQEVLPFTDLSGPYGVAVDASGTVYVADPLTDRVLRAAAGSTGQQPTPFNGLSFPIGVAVDSAGGVYVTDATSNQVLWLAAGSAKPEVLPFTGLDYPREVAVDSAGTVYVTNAGNGQVVVLAR